MSRSVLRLTAADSVLVFAPHPDDETLGAGGLLQVAARAGARIRVAFATDGENNPWPQRVLERRCRIDDVARRRFGVLRRLEAGRALRAIGLGECVQSYLGLPDRGVTTLALSDARSAIALIRAELAASRPTLVISPSPRDRHPDHSAFGVLVLAALASAPPIGDVRLLHYRIHRGPTPVADGSQVLMRLSAEEQEQKLRGISAHRSQLVFRSRFFRSFVSEFERFEALAACAPGDATHPVAWASVGEAGLELRIRSRPLVGPFSRRRVLLLGWGPAETSFALSLPARGRTLRLSPSRLPDLSRLFVKLERRWGLFDADGWREVSLAPNRVAADSAHSTGEVKRDLIRGAQAFGHERG